MICVKARSPSLHRRHMIARIVRALFHSPRLDLRSSSRERQRANSPSRKVPTNAQMCAAIDHRQFLVRIGRYAWLKYFAYRERRNAKTGKVKCFNDTKGFGFISSDGGGEDVFVHLSWIKSEGFKFLHEDQRVSFDVKADRKGPRAMDMHPI